MLLVHYYVPPLVVITWFDDLTVGHRQEGKFKEPQH